MNSKIIFFLVCPLFVFTTCQEDQTISPYDYGTQSDSARHYFMKGWEEILDNGRWTESEQAFRKASTLDPDWLLGKSLVGRITRDLEDRQEILRYLENEKDRAGEDERKLLDLQILSLKAANNRDQGIKNEEEFTDLRMKLAETNLGNFARKYPDDTYFKAEYIEFLHANYDAQTALDSLRTLATSEQNKKGFYISYAASLESEMGNIAAAKKLLKLLKQNLKDSTFTSPLMLQARTYMAQDSLQKASELVDKVVKMDTNHIIAIGTKRYLDNKINKSK